MRRRTIVMIRNQTVSETQHQVEGKGKQKAMNIEELREYCLSMGGVTEKTPFGRFATRFDSVLVFYILDHMFCMTDMDDFTSVTVKATPEVIESLKMTRSSVGSNRNMSERHWIQLNLNGDVPDREIYGLIKQSYEIVKLKYTKKRKKQH